MKIYNRIVVDIETGKVLEEDSFEYSGPVALAIREAEQQANLAGVQAGITAGTYGSNAANVNANLTPFLTRQMTNPSGMSQRDIGSQLTQGLAGAGGSTSGLTGAANKMGMTTRNPNGFASALDEAARLRDKTSAGVGVDVAANNAKVKLGQQQQATEGLGSMYGTNVKGQLESQSQIANDVLARTKAASQGWIQNWGDAANDVGSSADAAKKVAGLL